MPQAIIALGSNLGDRAGFIAGALQSLDAGAPATRVLAVSSVIETAPVGVLKQPKFLNAVAGIETTLKPENLLKKLFEIENAAGRVRTIRNGPRTLDLDLLFYENETRALPELTLPHPRWHERDFVKIPLAQLLEKSPFAQNPAWDFLRQKLGIF